jgi:PAS domain S-box-containing protein
MVGYVVHKQNRRLAAARDALRASEDRYRLIAENAGDLIAMIDHEGKWLYNSPSYKRILDAGDLAAGVDAFRRVHPDDAERARVGVLRSAATGKPREIALRLVDREGRIRQYKARVQSIGGTDEALASQRLLLVSQDVTDLRDSEERLLLAAHAFEGMTEAIVITASDGTIVTVNRAFVELSGFTRDDVLGQHERVIRNALQPPEFYDEVYRAVSKDGYWSGTTWARRKNGSVYREWRSVRAVKEGGGPITHYVMLFYEAGAGHGRPERSVIPA